MAVAIELVYHCFSFSWAQGFIKDGKDDKFRRQKLKVPFPLLQGSVDHRRRQLLPDYSQIVDLLQKVHGSTGDNQEFNAGDLQKHLPGSIFGRKHPRDIVQGHIRCHHFDLLSLLRGEVSSHVGRLQQQVHREVVDSNLKKPGSRDLNVQ